MFAVQRHKMSGLPIISFQKNSRHFSMCEHSCACVWIFIFVCERCKLKDGIRPVFDTRLPNYVRTLMQKLNRHHFVVTLELIIAIWMKLAKIYRISKRVSCCYPRAIWLDRRATLIWIISINQSVWIPEGSVLIVFMCGFCLCIVCTSHGMKGNREETKGGEKAHTKHALDSAKKYLNALRYNTILIQQRECTQKFKASSWISIHRARENIAQQWRKNWNSFWDAFKWSRIWYGNWEVERKWTTIGKYGLLKRWNG